jgi:hypothetical protein
MNRAGQNRPIVRLSDLCGILGLLVVAVTTLAQDSKPPDKSPLELVRAASANEVAAANNTSVKFLFRSRKCTPKGIQNRIYVEANEVVASMLVSENDQPLTSQKELVEINRLQSLANNPRQLRKVQAQEKQEMEHTLRILKALPHAFLYEYEGTEMSDTGLGRVGDQLVRLKFKPNPSYSPPTHVEQVLEGMQGHVLIDTTAGRFARVEGTLFKEVNFGYGIFGRLDKGGQFRVQLADAGDGNWEITQMNLKFSGTILLLKSFNMTSDEAFSDFQRLPDNVPFARGLELLQAEKRKLTQDTQELQASELRKSRATAQR